jgi:hypothetical protein
LTVVVEDSLTVVYWLLAYITRLGPFQSLLVVLSHLRLELV